MTNLFYTTGRSSAGKAIANPKSKTLRRQLVISNNRLLLSLLEMMIALAATESITVDVR